MEDTLRGGRHQGYPAQHAWVLILILMEDTLRENLVSKKKQKPMSLNPYSNGRYSTSPQHAIRELITDEAS